MAEVPSYDTIGKIIQWVSTNILVTSVTTRTILDVLFCLQSTEKML